MSLKLANSLTAQINFLVETQQVKNSPGLKEHILQGGSVPDELPKSYKGTLKVYDPCSYTYDKEHPKPKPIGTDGQIMKKPKTVASLAIQTDDRLKRIFTEENKKLKAAGQPTLDIKGKAKLLRKELKDPNFKSFYESTYPVKVAQYRTLYREAQFRTEIVKNKLYEFSEDTLEWNLKKSKKSSDDLSDDEDECNTPTSSNNLSPPDSDDEDEEKKD